MPPMTLMTLMTLMNLPRWLPAVAIVSFVLWAVTIWWMVATLPAGASSTPPPEVDALVAEVQRLSAEVARLDAYITQLRDERDGLLALITQSRALADNDSTASTFDGAAPEEDGATEPDVSLLFTDGVDRYNCRDFATYADAQEALLVNGAGDPNRIDMNQNGIACEDFRYPDSPGVTPRP
ncbi:MAG: hypothetical protein O2798_11245 [Chloroflexi bacterium]|nr:hypothetical protein [Chloroflexota bacterium]